MAKVLGPTARVGLGFWAQRPIFPAGDDTQLRAPHFSNPRAYPPPGATWIGTTNPNLFKPIFRFRTPHFSNPKPPLPPGPSWTFNGALFGAGFRNIFRYNETPSSPPPLPGKTWAWNGVLALTAGPPAELLEPRTAHFSPPRAPLPAGPSWLWFNLNLAAAPPAVPFSQDDWPITVLAPRAANLATWLWSYNLNLVGQDKLPAGEQISDLPPRAYAEPATRTWVWNYNVNLIGQDRLPVGEQISERPSLGYLQPLRSWTFSYNLNLIGQDFLPVGERVYDLPFAAQFPNALRTWIGTKTAEIVSVVPFSQDDWPNPQIAAQPLRTWLWSYNLNLIGKDQLPNGEQFYDRPPLGPQQPAQVWLWSYNLNLVGKDALPVGEQIYERPSLGHQQPAKVWTWNYNLNLIGQDFLPVGERIYDLPLAAQYPNQLRTWTAAGLAAIVGPVPFNQADWPTPKWPARANDLRTWAWNYNLNLIGKDQLPVGQRQTDLPLAALQPLRSWTWNYNLNLIAQDKLPVGEQIYDLPPSGYIYPNDLRTWIQVTKLALITAPAPLPFNQADWPTPKWPQRANDLRSWVWSYNLNLIGKDLLPFSQDDWPTPQLPQRANDLRSWVWNYNLNLIGKDALPPGDQRTELLQQPIYPNQLRTWISQVNLALTVAVVQFPFNQSDWPLPRWPQQPARSWTQSYNLNLIGKDQLPVGEISTALPLQPIYPNDLRTWITRTSLLLVPQPFNQFDWPNPQIARQPTRFWVNPRNTELFPPPPPAPLPFNQYHWPLPAGWFVPYRDRWWSSFINVSQYPPTIPVVPPRQPTRPAFRVEAIADRRAPIAPRRIPPPMPHRRN